MVLMNTTQHNTTQIIYLICSNGRHGYNYFQVQKDLASVRGQPLNRLGVVPIRANTVLTYIYIVGINSVLCVLSLCIYSTVIHTSPFCWDSRNHKLFYMYAFALSTPKRQISRDKQDSDHCCCCWLPKGDSLAWD